MTPEERATRALPCLCGETQHRACPSAFYLEVVEEIRAAVEAERERCAKVAEEMANSWQIGVPETALNIASAIRGRFWRKDPEDDPTATKRRQTATRPRSRKVRKDK